MRRVTIDENNAKSSKQFIIKSNTPKIKKTINNYSIDRLPGDFMLPNSEKIIRNKQDPSNILGKSRYGNLQGQVVSEII